MEPLASENLSLIEMTKAIMGIMVAFFVVRPVERAAARAVGVRLQYPEGRNRGAQIWL